jgi:polyhydroxyalkanoate synthase
MQSAFEKLDIASSLLAQRIEKIQKKLLDGTELLTETLDTKSDTTPKDKVLSVDRWNLYRYRPVVKNPHPIPVVIFYALINRYYMVDLQPDRSMVKKFLEAGLDVYVLDWGHPTRGDRYLTMEDYIDGYMNQVVDFIRENSGQDAITLYGICQGGTFSTIYTARNPKKVKNLAIMVAPIDFDSDAGLLNVWAKGIDAERMADVMGNVPGSLMNTAFLLLNPIRLLYTKYIDFLVHMDDPVYVTNFVRMEKWIFDSPDQAGAAFKQFVKLMYQENRLAKGTLVLGGKRVNLKKITQPVLNVFAEKDHLVPPECSRPFTKLVGSKDKTVLSYPTGHIGLFTSGRSQKEYAPAIADWLVRHCSGDAPAAAPKKRSVKTKTARKAKKQAAGPKVAKKAVAAKKVKAAKKTKVKTKKPAKKKTTRKA